MTPAELERDCLSLHVWVSRCVLPAAALLLALLALLYSQITIPQYRDQSAAILGFFILYFVLVRGGHMIMIRSLHFELKRTYGKAYEKKLAALPRNMRRHNLGFALARIKRTLIDAQNARRDRFKD